MTLQSLNRYKAFGLHLALSVLIAATVFTLIVLVWYPRPYFDAMGGEVLLRLLIGVDVVLGPIITLIIFDPAKPRLRQDLTIIGVMQLAALAYGGFVMFEARPVYNVFVKDRFETVAANSIDEASLARAPSPYRDLPLTGPRIVAAQQPADPEERNRLRLATMVGGHDVQDLPHLYQPYSDVAMQAAKVAKPLVGLSQKGQEAATAVSEFAAAYRVQDPGLGYVPVRARNRDFTAVVDRKTGEIVGYLPVNPW